VTARSLVGVVADERGVRDRAVDAAVDPGEGGCDFVHGPMKVVDASLERDGEVDEVGLAAAKQHELARANPPDLKGDVDRHEERRPCSAGRADGDPGCRREAHRTEILEAMPRSAL